MIDFRNCDALDLIADLKSKGTKIDLVVTDPPYLINYKSEKVNAVNRRKLHGDNEFSGKAIRKIMYAVEEILADNAAIFMFTSWQKVEHFKQVMSEIATLHSCIVWYKNAGGMGDLKRAFAPSYELILYGTKGDVFLPYRYQDFISANRVTGSSKSIHPTQKPVDLLRYLIRSVKNSDSPINLLDPFAGSGSTLLAGHHEHCNCYGAELDEEYHTKGMAWIKDKTTIPGLFDNLEEDLGNEEIDESVDE